MSPRRSLLSGAKFCFTSTSMPLSTVAVRGGTRLGEFVVETRLGSLVGRGAKVPGAFVKLKPSTASAANVASVACKGRMLPWPSGCTRLERKIQNVSEKGSIQSDVPVNPVWPYEPSGNSCPLGLL